MSYKNLISSDYLYKVTTIDDSVDPKLLLQSIHNAQTIDLQACLGNKMYYFIMDGISNSGVVTLNDDYKYLIKEYIQPALAQSVLYYVTPYLNYKLTNKSVSQKRSEYSDPSDLEVIKYLVLMQKNTAKTYMERLKDYICLHSNKFPEYNQMGENGLNARHQPQFNSPLYISSKYRGAGNNKNRYDDDCDCGGSYGY